MYILAINIGVVIIAPILAGTVSPDSIFMLIAALNVSLAGFILNGIVWSKSGLREMFGRFQPERRNLPCYNSFILN